MRGQETMPVTCRLLLQLTHDDLVGWSFGDNGCYPFWITPDDLRRQRWSAVRMTIESH